MTVADGSADLHAVEADMATMRVALFQHNQAYQAFYFHAHQQDWERAAASQLEAIVSLEASMDAFLSASQKQKKIDERDR